MGQLLEELGAAVKSVSNAFAAAGAIASTGFAQALDFVFRLSPQKQFEDLSEKVKGTEERIESLTKNVEENGNKSGIIGLVARSNKREIDDLNLSLEEDNKGLERLKTNLGLLDGQNIKINIDLSGIETAQENIKNLFADLKTKAEQDAGVFKVPGFSDAGAAEIFNKYKTAKEEFDNSLNKTEALDKFKSKLGELETTVAGAPIRDATKELATGVVELAKAASSGDFSKASQLFETLGGSLQKVKDSARSAQVGLKGFSSLIQGAEKAVAEKTKAQLKDTKDTLAGIKKQEKEFENFVKSLRRSLKTAIPQGFQKELIDTFNNGGLSAEQFEKALIDIGKRAKAAGVDMGAFSKEIADLQKLADKGVDLVLNAETSEATDKIKSDIQDILKDAQSGLPNIRELIFGKDPSGKATGGGFFGFDLGLGAEEEAQVAGALQQSLSNVLNIAVDGVTRDDVPELGRAIGSAIGAAIAVSLGVDPATGAAIGGLVGEAVGLVAQNFGKDKNRD